MQVRVAVFDTGIDAHHRSFSHIEDRSNWTDEDTLEDRLGHGYTHKHTHIHTHTHTHTHTRYWDRSNWTDEECSNGRVAVSADYRNLGLGRDLMNTALAFCDSRWASVRLSAQCYLQAFYESLDFTAEGEPYLEDDIPHIEMVRRA